MTRHFGEPTDPFELYRKMQAQQHATAGTQPTSPNAKQQPHDGAHSESEALLSRLATDAKDNPARYIVVAGIATAAITGLVVQPFVGNVLSNPSNQENGSMIAVGTQSAREQKVVDPTGTTEDITFVSLLGKRTKIGSLFMKTVDADGQIIYKRSDRSKDTVTLPDMEHQQNFEIYAEPLLSENSDGTFKPSTPLSVEQKGEDFVVTVDRSKVAVVPNYAMPGTYTATDANSKGTTVTLDTDSKQDSFSIGFLPSSSTPVPSNEAGLSTDEIVRVNGLAAPTQEMAVTEAKLLSLMQSIHYVNAVASNECYTGAADSAPADTNALITQRIDAILKAILDKWASEHHRVLYINPIGNYPLDSSTILKQYAAYAAAGKSATAKEVARDTDTIMTNQYASYFGVIAKKVICTPNNTLKATTYSSK